MGGDAGFRVRWWHAVVFWLAVNAYSALSDDRVPFPGHVESPLQPPAIAFPIAWFSITIVQLWGDVRMINTRHRIWDYDVLVALQLCTWVLYASFSYVYFTLGSPILALVWTVLFFVLTVVSITLVRHNDRAIALSWLPGALWTAFASVVAVHTVLINPDPLFGTAALLPP
ncbi:tryptophan-rich sensory protein [Azospirillum halopraeferens]|uniref:tryptophan-rich sensory protein n=1 Tax=Azospirillum halopraeferens TaxID=34010 RepID=UPI00041DD2DD|nr:tryptophan-rich sensory protein [Azospirillum halopraeferens]